MEYWRRVISYAWESTRKTLRIETGMAITVLVAVQLVIAAVGWFLAKDENLATRFGTVIAPFLLLPCVFVYEFFATPGRLGAEMQSKLATPEKRKADREALAELSERGTRLRKRCTELDGDDLDKEVRVWVDEVFGFLKDRFDKSYATRFLSEAGFLTVDFVHPSMTKHQRDMALWIEHRITRLHEMMDRLS